MHSLNVFKKQFFHEPAWQAGVLSILVSVWSVLTDDLTNSDTIRYVEAARIFLEHGFQASYERYYWPFYSILMAGFSQLTSMGLEASAHCLNALFAGVLGFSFIRCVEALGADRRVCYAAMTLFLVNVSLNDSRDLVVRDIAYWACFFTSMWMLFSLKQTRRYRYAVVFFVVASLGVLFRIEGMFILVAGPLILLWRSGDVYRDLKGLLLVASLGIVSAIVATQLFLSPSSQSASLFSEGSRLYEIVMYVEAFWEKLTVGVEDKALRLEQYVLPYNAKSFGVESVYAIMLMTWVLKVFETAGLLQVGLAVWALSRPSIRESIKNKSVVFWLLLINGFILFVFVVVQFFLSPRYVVPFGLMVSLLAAFGLAELYKGVVATRFNRALRVLLSVAIVALFVDGMMSFGTKKHYIKDAAQWIDEHAPQEARFVSNNEFLYYYSGRHLSGPLKAEYLQFYHDLRLGGVPSGSVDQFDWVAFQISRKQPEQQKRLTQWVGLEPEKIFSNARGDRVAIYQLASGNTILEDDL